MHIILKKIKIRLTNQLNRSSQFIFIIFDDTHVFEVNMYQSSNFIHNGLVLLKGQSKSNPGLQSRGRDGSGQNLTKAFLADPSNFFKNPSNPK